MRAQVARSPANTVATSSLQIGMMMAVRASGARVCPATLRADSDPVWPVRKALPANKTQHKTALTTEQIGKLLNDFDNHRCTFQINYCMQLMWWTLARPSEVAEAEWTEIDLDRAQWRIPAERMKARKEHVVPLPTQAVEMLRGLKAITGQRK